MGDQKPALLGAEFLVPTTLRRQQLRQEPDPAQLLEFSAHVGEAFGNSRFCPLGHDADFRELPGLLNRAFSPYLSEIHDAGERIRAFLSEQAYSSHCGPVGRISRWSATPSLYRELIQTDPVC
jgi:hypothetical protein